MPWEPRNRGARRPRHAATDDHDLLWGRRRSDVTELGLAAGGGVLDARDRLALADPVDAPFVRPHARSDVVGPARARLPREGGGGDQRPRHAAHADVPRPDALVGADRVA